MKKTILTVILTTLSLPIYAGFECKKGDNIFKAKLHGTLQTESKSPVALGSNNILTDLKLNNGYRGSYELFERILVHSKMCKDIGLYTGFDTGQVYLCAGEMFAPRGIYGQVIVSDGALQAFKDTMAPVSGWSCK